MQVKATAAVKTEFHGAAFCKKLYDIIHIGLCVCISADDVKKCVQLFERLVVFPHLNSSENLEIDTRV